MFRHRHSLLTLYGATIAPPVNTVAPSISGTAAQGQTLTGSDGTWTGSPTIARQWKRNGSAIVGATSSTYVVTAADIGATLTYAVTATNAGGSTMATSAGTTILATFVNPIATAPLFIFDGRDGLDGYGAGAAISPWADKSGNGRDAANGTAGDRPAQTTLNTFPAASFDGAGDCLATAAFSQSQPLTYFLVLKRTVAGNNKYIMRGGVTGNPPGLFEQTGNVSLYAGTNLAPQVTLGAGTAALITAVFNTTSSEAFLNGMSTGTGNPGNTAITSLIIGGSATGGGGNYANVVIAACYGYPGALGTSDRQAVEAYLTARYGL